MTIAHRRRPWTPRPWRRLELFTVSEPRGTLTVVESGGQIPFSIEREYHVYDVPAGGRRAGHAHHSLEEVLIAVAGSFVVVCDDGRNRERVHLDRPDVGLYVPGRVWIEISEFALGSVCLVLASARFDPSEDWSDYEEFAAAVTGDTAVP